LFVLFCFNKGGEFVVHNFVGVIQDISPTASLVETDLFPTGALHYYTKKNMGWDYSPQECEMWQLPERGGEQGDYRDGMTHKIQNVIHCLQTEPWNKRAVIPIPYALQGSATIDWKDVGQNKCCRELHFYMENGTCFSWRFRVVVVVVVVRTQTHMCLFSHSPLPFS
jgi:hypothetical protein